MPAKEYSKELVEACKDFSNTLNDEQKEKFIKFTKELMLYVDKVSYAYVKFR